jgi:hypothetical protein
LRESFEKRAKKQKRRAGGLLAAGLGLVREWEGKPRAWLGQKARAGRKAKKKRKKRKGKVFISREGF